MAESATASAQTGMEMRVATRARAFIGTGSVRERSRACQMRTSARASSTASPSSPVDAVPPRSGVGVCSAPARPRRRARRASRGRPSPCSSSSAVGAEHRRRVRDPAAGDVRRRAVHGLEEAGPASPRLADGARPSPPVTAAARSERMSPNMFSVTMTSNCSGARDELHRGVVDEHVLDARRRGSRRRSRVDDAPPHARRLQHVRLVDRRQASGAARGRARRPRRTMRSTWSGGTRRCRRRCRRRARLARRSRARRRARGRSAGRSRRAAPAAGSRRRRAPGAGEAAPARAGRRPRRTPGRRSAPSGRRRAARQAVERLVRAAACRSRGSRPRRTAAPRARRPARGAVSALRLRHDLRPDPVSRRGRRPSMRRTLLDPVDRLCDPLFVLDEGEADVALSVLRRTRRPGDARPSPSRGARARTPATRRRGTLRDPRPDEHRPLRLGSTQPAAGEPVAQGVPAGAGRPADLARDSPRPRSCATMAAIWMGWKVP